MLFISSPPIHLASGLGCELVKQEEASPLLRFRLGGDEADVQQLPPRALRSERVQSPLSRKRALVH